MSRFIFKILAVAALAVGNTVAVENGVLLSEAFGGPHGTRYSDLDLVEAGQTVQSITIRAGERVNGVGIEVINLAGQRSTFYHGGGGGDPKTLTLAAGEFVTGIEAHWGEKDDHTRIKYLSFTTSAGNTLSGGNPTKNIGQDTAPANFQLGGFVGTSGGELDSVGAIWTSVTPVE